MTRTCHSSVTRQAPLDHGIDQQKSAGVYVMTHVDVAWGEVMARWADQAAHRSFLDACGDLAALAEAGRRYKAVLDARPDDAVAARWRDAVVKRATAFALAQLPRTRPPREMSPWLRRALPVALVWGAITAAAWISATVIPLHH
jgi:hypothetical protein